MMLLTGGQKCATKEVRRRQSLISSQRRCWHLCLGYLLGKFTASGLDYSFGAPSHFLSSFGMAVFASPMAVPLVNSNSKRLDCRFDDTSCPFWCGELSRRWGMPANVVRRTTLNPSLLGQVAAQATVFSIGSATSFN